jgi:hypothetical protein
LRGDTKKEAAGGIGKRTEYANLAVHWHCKAKRRIVRYHVYAAVVRHP